MAGTVSTVDIVLSLARTQIGYHEGRNASGWDNIQKYSEQVPGLTWSDGQPWCATFVSWCFWKNNLLKLMPGGATASVAHIRDAGKAAHRFSQYPAIGAIAIYGIGGDAHTGIVESYTSTTITAIEGNTNTNGSPEGDGVYRKVRQRTDAWVYGYVYPTYPEGITSADPAWAREAPKPPTANHVTAGRALITKGLAELDAARIGGKPRPAVRAMAAAIRAALAAGPKY